MNARKRITIAGLLLLVLSGLGSFALAKTTEPVVNVLAWFGVLQHPKALQKIAKTCHVSHIYTDQYYSNDEFLRRWHEHRDQYDILVFSAGQYHRIIDPDHYASLPINQLATQYQPTIKQFYDKQHYPQNVLIFDLAATGFLYNPNLMQVSPQDTIQRIFQKAGNHRVAIGGSAQEISDLIGVGLPNVSRDPVKRLTYRHIKALIPSDQLSLMDSPTALFRDPQFALAYLLSYNAMQSIQTINPKLQFTFQSQASMIVSDLLMTTSARPEVACVAKQLGGKTFTTLVANQNFYFSPYLSNTAAIQNKRFKAMYQQFLALLPTLHWNNDRLSHHDLMLRQYQFQQLRLAILSEKRKSP